MHDATIRSWNLKVSRTRNRRTITRFKLFEGTLQQAEFALARFLDTLVIDAETPILGVATPTQRWVGAFEQALVRKCEDCGITAEGLGELVFVSSCRNCGKMVCEDCQGAYDCKNDCGASGCRSCMSEINGHDGCCSDECQDVYLGDRDDSDREYDEYIDKKLAGELD